MRFELWLVGKTKATWVDQGTDFYLRKCQRYGKVEQHILRSSKNADPISIKREESGEILHRLDKSQAGWNILLDERGKEYTSIDFADHIQQLANHNQLPIRFIVGGPYGVTAEVRERADEVMAFSRMVLPHELIRILLAEQIYRALTIIRGEPYHHK